MMQVSAQGSKEALAQESREFLPWGFVPDLKTQARGSQSSGKVTIFFSEKFGGSCMLNSSSIIVPGGEPAVVVGCRRRCLASFTAHLNSRCRFLLEVAAYQPAPLRGHPLNHGMTGMKVEAKSLKA